MEGAEDGNPLADWLTIPCGETFQANREENALLYLKTVKKEFRNAEDKYAQLLGALNDLEDGKINLVGLIVRVKELFKDNDELIALFNEFLPDGYEILAAKKPLDYDLALHFLGKLKARFEDDPHTYDKFVGIICRYRQNAFQHRIPGLVYHSVEELYRGIERLLDPGSQKRMANEVVVEVRSLLKEHQDLLQEFSFFTKVKHPTLPVPKLPPSDEPGKGDKPK